MAWKNIVPKWRQGKWGEADDVRSVEVGANEVVALVEGILPLVPKLRLGMHLGATALLPGFERGGHA